MERAIRYKFRKQECLFLLYLAGHSSSSTRIRGSCAKITTREDTAIDPCLVVLGMLA